MPVEEKYQLDLIKKIDKTTLTNDFMQTKIIAMNKKWTNWEKTFLILVKKTLTNFVSKSKLK